MSSFVASPPEKYSTSMGKLTGLEAGHMGWAVQACQAAEAGLHMAVVAIREP